MGKTQQSSSEDQAQAKTKIRIAIARQHRQLPWLSSARRQQGQLAAPSKPWRRLWRDPRSVLSTSLSRRPTSVASGRDGRRSEEYVSAFASLACVGWLASASSQSQSEKAHAKK